MLPIIDAEVLLGSDVLKEHLDSACFKLEGFDLGSGWTKEIEVRVRLNFSSLNQETVLQKIKEISGSQTN